jgi:hypothetical protein
LFSASTAQEIYFITRLSSSSTCLITQRDFSSSIHQPALTVEIESFDSPVNTSVGKKIAAGMGFLLCRGGLFIRFHSALIQGLGISTLAHWNEIVQRSQTQGIIDKQFQTEQPSVNEIN